MTIQIVAAQPILGWARQVRRRHPESAVVLVVAAAWLVLSLAPAGSAHQHLAVPATGPGPLAWWTAMCLAMMVPGTIPALRHVAGNSLRRRQQGAIAWFTAAYLAVWLVFGMMVQPLIAAVAQFVPHPRPAAGALAVAALWQFLPYQREFRRACHRLVALPPAGWRAARADLRFGLRHGLSCVGVCGPLMLVAASLSHHDLPWMLALSVAVILVKVPPLSPLGRRAFGLALAAVAAAVLVHY